MLSVLSPYHPGFYQGALISTTKTEKQLTKQLLTIPTLKDRTKGTHFQEEKEDLQDKLF